jgi:hypothetical protein
MAKKRGRPRKPGPRTKSGRLSRAYKAPELRDKRTPEFCAKRAYLINWADPQLAATVSGILFANGHLTMAQRDAGENYANLHRLAFGNQWGHACVLDDSSGRSISDERLVKLRRILDAMHAYLTPEQRQAIADVAVFGWLPQGFFTARLRLRLLPEDEREREALLSGLDALAGRER